MRETVNGSCHCGTVTFQADVDATDGLFVRCNCSLCRRKNRGVAVIAADNFHLVHGAEQLRIYRWNTGREAHYFCGQCGIHTHHTLADPPARIGINLACLAGRWEETAALIDGDGASLSLVDDR